MRLLDSRIGVNWRAAAKAEEQFDLRIQQPGDFHRRSLRRFPGSCCELTMSPSPVATCRQTVEGFYNAVHRLAADGYVWQPMVTNAH